MSVTAKRIVKYAKQAGIEVSDNMLVLKMFFKGYSAFGRVGGNLADDQKIKIEQFCDDVKAQIYESVD